MPVYKIKTTLYFLNVASSHDSFFFSVSSGKLLIIIIIDDAVITILDSHLYLWILEKKAFSIGQPLPVTQCQKTGAQFRT